MSRDEKAATLARRDPPPDLASRRPTSASRAAACCSDGYYADVVVFDPAKIQDHATFEKPQQLSTGVRDVFVNGTQVLKDGKHTGAKPGRVVRGPGWTGWAGRRRLQIEPFRRRRPIGRAAMTDSTSSSAGSAAAACCPSPRIVRAGGAKVAGSDRSLDAGRIAGQVRLSALARDRAVPAGRLGASAEGMTLVTSAAVEDTVPDVVRARELGLDHLTRPQFLAELLNAAQRSVAVGGTSGKSTVTGMIGWILHACHRQPTVMNGAVMKNFVTPVRALRQRSGRRPRTVRQRGRRKRRLDRALPARSRGADQHQPRP